MDIYNKNLKTEGLLEIENNMIKSEFSFQIKKEFDEELKSLDFKTESPFLTIDPKFEPSENTASKICKKHPTDEANNNLKGLSCQTVSSSNQFDIKLEVEEHLLKQEVDTSVSIKFDSSNLEDSKCDTSFLPFTEIKTEVLEHTLSQDSLENCKNQKKELMITSDKPSSANKFIDGVSHNICQICRKSSSENKEWHIHCHNTHTNNSNETMKYKIYKCNACSYHTLSDTEFRLHKKIHKNKDQFQIQKVLPRRHNNNRPFLCQGCNNRFTLKERLDAHIVSQHSLNQELMKKVTSTIKHCNKCSYKTVFNFNLQSHLLKHKDKIEVDINNKKLQYRKILARKRFQRSDNPKIFACRECNKWYTSKRYLDDHILVKHMENKKMVNTVTNVTYSCNKCSYKTVRISKIKSHLECHKVNVTNSNESNVPKYLFNKNDFKTIHKDKLITHLKITPKQPKLQLSQQHQQSYLCEACDESFPRKNQLDIHIAKKHFTNKHLMNSITYKIFSCKKCDFKTLIQSKLDTHIKTHKDVEEIRQQYQCHTCNFITTSKSYIKSHMLFHSGRFLCRECNKRFTKTHDLDSHILSKHFENEEMLKTIVNEIYSCSTCCYKTVHVSKLKRHLVTHNNKKSL